MIAAIDRFLGEHGPGTCSRIGTRIPEFCRADRLPGIEGVEAGSLGAARDQHRAVQQDRGIVLAPPEMHQGGRAPGWRACSQIYRFGTVGGLIACVVLTATYE